jgi:hypothetical protein
MLRLLVRAVGPGSPALEASTLGSVGWGARCLAAVARLDGQVHVVPGGASTSGTGLQARPARQAGAHGGRSCWQQRRAFLGVLKAPVSKAHTERRLIG